MAGTNFPAMGLEFGRGISTQSCVASDIYSSRKVSNNSLGGVALREASVTVVGLLGGASSAAAVSKAPAEAETGDDLVRRAVVGMSTFLQVGYLILAYLQMQNLVWIWDHTNMLYKGKLKAPSPT